VKAAAFRTLDELVQSGAIQLTRGKIISKKDMAACPGSYPVYSSAKENDGKFGEYGRFMFDEELITWSVDGGGRLFHRPRHKFSVPNVGGVLRIRDRRVLDYKFLHYVLSLRHSEIRFDWVKKAHPSIIRKLYQGIPVPPLPEQQRIVGVLDKAFDRIAAARANAQKNLQNARALFESHVQSVFTERGEGWVEKPLGALASFRNGINYTKDSKGERVKIVGVKDFQKSYWVPSQNLDTVTIDGTLSELDFLKRGDILAVRSNGNLELIGRCILAGDVPEKISHSGFTIRIRLSTGQVLPEYLCHFMKCSGSRKRLTDGGTGTNIKSLNQQTLSALRIPFPSAPEQKALVARLESVSAETQRLQSIYQQKLDALDALKKSLLRQAFTGSLQ
jgi:type I restriction enzyme S subunit